MALNFSPDDFIPHFSYGFYKKKIFTELSYPAAVDDEHIAGLEKVVNDLLNCNSRFRIAAIVKNEDLLKALSVFLPVDYRATYVNCSPDQFWTGMESIPYHNKDTTATVTIHFIKAVNWNTGELYQNPKAGDSIHIYNLSGFFPYEKCPENADMIIIPFNAGVGMERIGTMVMINEQSSLSGSQDEQVIDNLLLQLSTKMFGDINAQIDLIRRDYQYKYVVLTQAIITKPGLELTVKDDAERSKSIIGFKLMEDHLSFQHKLENHKVVLGNYPDKSSLTYRVANFHSHSKEQFERLADILSEDQ